MSQHIKTWQEQAVVAGFSIKDAENFSPERKVAFIQGENERLRAALSRRPDSGKVAEGWEIVSVQALETGSDRESPHWFDISAQSEQMHRDEGYKIRRLYTPAADSAATEQAKPKIEISREWCERMAALEGEADCNIAAGVPPAERAAEPVSEAVKIVDEIRSFFAIDNNQAMFDAAGKLYAMLAAAPASADVGELPHGVIECMEEAADVLSGEKPMREPLSDELAGFAGMLRETQASSAALPKDDGRITATMADVLERLANFPFTHQKMAQGPLEQIQSEADKVLKRYRASQEASK